MNKYVTLLSAAAVLLFSCSREPEPVIQPGETITFTAAWAGSEDTRTILQADGTSVWWEPGAQVNVFFSDKASGKFTSTNSQAQAIVDFQGSLPIVVGSVETENPPHAYWAVYPYDAANNCDGESVTLTIPSAQTAVEGTFANKMFPSIATSTNFYLAFYNICGGVRFTVANEGIASVTFKANNGESLAGKVKVGFEGVPMVKSVFEGVSEVVVNAPDGGFIPGKYYFAALLPQTLTKGVSITFKKDDEKVASTSLDNSITINRSRFGKMDEKDKGLEFKDDGSGPNPSDNIVFADSKVKERLVAKFDTNGDGELSYAEAAAVTSIEGALTIKTITSFDEFQYFTGVTSIPASYFEDWTKMVSITLPRSISYIGESAFKNCSKLTSLFIPEGVSGIENETFRGCTELRSILLPNSIAFLGNAAFSGCSCLSTIDIPYGVTSIGKSAFSNCTSLLSVMIPATVSSIGDGAFFECQNLVSVDLSDSITIIANELFYGCISLSSIVIPENVTSIGGQAFYMTGISSIIIPKSVTNIGQGAFRGTALASIQVDLRNTVYDSRADCNAIIETASNTLITGCKNTTIPENVKSIADYAFNGSGLVSISIPDGVTNIGYAAFARCADLISVMISESVTTIGKNAFGNCTSLTTINIPESITSIEENTFWGCTSLISMTIPESVRGINKNAFNGCSSLARLWVLPENPPYLSGSGMFYNVQDIYVPASSVETYKTANIWKDLADRIQAIPE